MEGGCPSEPGQLAREPELDTGASADVVRLRGWQVGTCDDQKGARPGPGDEDDQGGGGLEPVAEPRRRGEAEDRGAVSGPGFYRGRYNGFQQRTVRGVSLAVNDRALVDASLSAGGVSERKSCCV